MDYLVIEGVKPWDGRYEFDLAGSELTTREWGWIKRFSGYMPLTVEAGFEGGDPELYACFAVVALRRAGRIGPGDAGDVFERIADAPFGSAIRMETDPADEADADPPPSSSNGSTHSSGDDSATSSASSTGPPSGSGMPASAISGWPQARSET